MARPGALQAKANMTVAADNSVVVGYLPKAAAASGRPLSVVVECDTGRKRAGVETPAEAIALAREIAASKGLTFAGFMLYPTETGWADAQKFFDEALAGVRAHQYPREYRRRRPHRAQPCLRRRQHDGRGGDGARRRDRWHAAGGSKREVAVGAVAFCRHCGEHSDEAIHNCFLCRAMDCFAS